MVWQAAPTLLICPSLRPDVKKKIHEKIEIFTSDFLCSAQLDSVQLRVFPFQPQGFHAETNHVNSSTFSQIYFSPLQVKDKVEGLLL